MAFGQQSGPPSSAKQVAEITELLEQAGFASLREARHPFGLSQRQANGKFTRDEADELIARLRDDPDGDTPDTPAVREAGSRPDRPAGSPADRPAARESDRRAARESDRQAEVVAGLPDAVLADELVRRGWMCMPPS